MANYQLTQTGAKIQEDLNLSEHLFNEFSSSSTYVVGDIVTYSGVLYKCTTAIATAGAWDSSKWTVVKVDSLLSTKQDTLVSGTTIKTINNTSLLGSGNISISGGSSIPTITIDSAQVTSTSPLQFTLTSAQQTLWGSQSPVIEFSFPSSYSSYSGAGTYKTSINGYILDTGYEEVSLANNNGTVTVSSITIAQGQIPEHAADEVLIYSKAPFYIGVSNPQWDGNLYTNYDANAWDGTEFITTHSYQGYYYVILYGVGNTVINSNLNIYSTTGTLIYCIGNINVLLDTSYANRTDLVLPANCFKNLFNSCNNVDFDITLPAISVGNYCYSGMFANCNSITKAPELPATTLGQACYTAMFLDCTGLSKTPEVLPATTLAEGCYEGMFYDCYSLQNTPRLPATTLASNCYKDMFGTCYSLLTLPELPATTLAENCYRGMFADCPNIKLSTTQTGEYQTEYRIPSVGTGTDATNALNRMFGDTGGTFEDGTPTINTTYYTSNRIIMISSSDISSAGVTQGKVLTANGNGTTNWEYPYLVVDATNYGSSATLNDVFSSINYWMPFRATNDDEEALSPIQLVIDGWTPTWVASVYSDGGTTKNNIRQNFGAYIDCDYFNFSTVFGTESLMSRFKGVISGGLSYQNVTSSEVGTHIDSILYTSLNPIDLDILPVYENIPCGFTYTLLETGTENGTIVSFDSSAPPYSQDFVHILSIAMTLANIKARGALDAVKLRKSNDIDDYAITNKISVYTNGFDFSNISPEEFALIDMATTYTGDIVISMDFNFGASTTQYTIVAHIDNSGGVNAWRTASTVTLYKKTLGSGGGGSSTTFVDWS